MSKVRAYEIKKALARYHSDPHKRDNYDFGLEVQGKIGEIITEQETTNKELKKKLERFEGKEEIINDFIHYLDLKGLLSGWGSNKELKDNWKDKLEEILGSSLASHEKHKIEDVIDAAERLKKII